MRHLASGASVAPALDTLPDCRTRTPTARKMHMGISYVPIFCATCHVAGPYVPEENTTFAFWLCHKCEHQWSPVASTMSVPDEVFFQKVADEQMESFGRYLSPTEMTEALKDDRNTLTRLAKDR